MKIKLEFRVLTTYKFEVNPELDGLLRTGEESLKYQHELIQALKDADPKDLMSKNWDLKPVDQYEECQLTDWDIVK